MKKKRTKRTIATGLLAGAVALTFLAGYTSNSDAISVAKKMEKGSARYCRNAGDCRRGVYLRPADCDELCRDV